MKRFVVVVLASLVLVPARSGDADGQLHDERHRGLERMVPEQRHDSLGGHGAGNVTSSTGCELAELVTTEGTVVAHVHSHVQRRLDVVDRDAEDRQDGARRLGRDAGACSRRERLVQPPGRVRVLGNGRNVRHRRLLGPVLRRRRRLLGVGHGHVHRRRRQREQHGACRSSTTPPSDRLALRRPAARPQGLVPEARHGELRRHGPHVRDRSLYSTHAVRRPGSTKRCRGRVVPRRGRELG